MSGCGLILEGRHDSDAGIDARASVDAFLSDGRSTDSASDVFLDANGVYVEDAFEFQDVYAFPDAYELPDAHVCRPEACNGIDDDCNSLIDDGVCLVSGVMCTGHSAEGHSYILCDTDVAWEQARDRCASMTDFHLVKIESREEDDFVWSLAMSLDWPRRGIAWEMAPRLWIGLRDTNSLLAQTWTWLDETRLGMGFWRTSEPSADLLETCVEMRGWALGGGRFDHGWNNSVCGVPTRAFLCERDTP